MHTHAERSQRERPAAATSSGRAQSVAPSAGAGAPPEIINEEDATALQRSAGNRATVQRIRAGAAVQRELAPGQAATIASRLHDAMSGLGTDEEAVYGALTSRTPDEIETIKDAYYFAYDTTLYADINDEFSGEELARALRLLEGTPAPGAEATEAETGSAATASARAVAEQLRDAMVVVGTEEDQIYNALEGRTADQIDEIRRQYMDLTGHSIDRDLRDELSGDELDRALALVNAGNSGTFRNTFTEYLTEDLHAVGSGIWDWEIVDGSFLVHVGVRFERQRGVTAPISTWQTQVANTWNRYALTANGGLAEGGIEYPILFDLQDQPGAERTVRVLPNAKPGEYGNGDRAYADLWYPVMRPTIAPHEFGHLVGLADEYERTREDFADVTGETVAGPSNGSGLTSEEIAERLNAALYDQPEASRAREAEQVLTQAGLIVGGAAQQGAFAQQVMERYDSRYEGVLSRNLLQAIRYRCAPGSFWTLIAVFSFESNTIMGNESDHTHPVAPRHLRFVQQVAQERYPEVTWGLREVR